MKVGLEHAFKGEAGARCMHVYATGERCGELAPPHPKPRTRVRKRPIEHHYQAGPEGRCVAPLRSGGICGKPEKGSEGEHRARDQHGRRAADDAIWFADHEGKNVPELDADGTPMFVPKLGRDGKPKRWREGIQILPLIGSTTHAVYTNTRGEKTGYVAIGDDGRAKKAPDGSIPLLQPLTRHIATYAIAVNEKGDVLGEREDDEAGLSTDQLLEFWTGLAEKRFPKRQTPHLALHGFSWGYDSSLLVRDLCDLDVWLFTRPDERKIEWAKSDPRHGMPQRRAQVYYPRRTPCTSPACRACDELRREGVREGPTYKLDYLRGQLTIQRVDRWRWTKPNSSKGKRQKAAVGPKVTLHDMFAFVSCSFFQAITDWKIGTLRKRLEIKAMKDKRSDFEHEPFPKVKKYARDECYLGARFTKKLIESFSSSGYPLREKFGAGSAAKAFLEHWGARRWYRQAGYRKKGGERVDGLPQLKDGTVAEAMRGPIAEAYQGGWFEPTYVGPVDELVTSWDIRSAYPYSFALGMPCMRHGHWERVRGGESLHATIAAAPYALVRARARRGACDAFGPFGWREDGAAMPDDESVREDGDIIRPLATPEGGCWVWSPEYLAAKSAPHRWDVEAIEAWIYRSSCDCKPFVNEVPERYARRVYVGRNGEGLATKLALNGGYGVTSQATGSHPWQCWTWAGICTSRCRAQVMQAIAVIDDPWRILAVATDGLYVRGDFDLAKLCPPKDTGTGQLPTREGKMVNQPLGGWEREAKPLGMFFLKAGVYFSLDLAADEADGDDKTEKERVRARGIGRRVLKDHRAEIVQHWSQHQATSMPRYVFEDVRRFVGMKSGILRHRDPKTGKYRDPKRDAEYGRFIERDQAISFEATPKRRATTPSGRLLAWELPASETSKPYGPADPNPKKKPYVPSRAAQELQAAHATRDDAKDPDDLL